MKKKSVSQKTQLKNMFKWFLTFTKNVVTLVTISWVLYMLFSAIMIFYAIKVSGNFSYLDTFITDNGDTFRLIVGTYIVTKTVENVFKYNEGSIFGKSITPQVPKEETVG